MKQMIFGLGLAMVLVSTQVGMAQTGSGSAQFSKGAITVNYPAHWTVDTSGTMGTQFLVFTTLESETDQFRENVSGMIQDMTGQGVTMEMYKQVTEQQLATMLTDGKILESSISKVGNKTYYRAIYTMTQGVYKLKVVSSCFIDEEKAYLATYTAEVDKFDVYQKEAEMVLRSYRVAR